LSYKLGAPKREVFEMSKFIAFYGNKVVVDKKAVNSDDGKGTYVEVDLGSEFEKCLREAYTDEQVDGWLMNGYRDKLMGISNTITKGDTTNSGGIAKLEAELLRVFGVKYDGTNAYIIKTNMDKPVSESKNTELAKKMAGLVDAGVLELAIFDADTQAEIKKYTTKK